MEALPGDVAAELARAVAAFIRTKKPSEIPARLRPVQKMTHGRGAVRHRDALLGALEDEAIRARVLEWLDDKPPLSKRQSEALTLAAARPQGWRERLKGLSTERARSVPSRDPAISPGSDDDLDRAKTRARRARAEARTVRAERDRLVAASEGRIASLQERVSSLEQELSGARAAVREAEEEAGRARAEADRTKRRARRQVEDAGEAVERQRARAKELAAESRSLRQQVADLQDQLHRLRRATRKDPVVDKPPPGRREPLPVPPGLFEDSPEAFIAWLESPAVSLVVDGYNVTLSESGFGDLSLEDQRRLLYEGLVQVARRYQVPTTIVFDGAHMTAGTRRLARGPVAVEFSVPGEVADDHIVAKLAGMPPDPVIVVTNDRELQRRAAEMGATVAVVDQLLQVVKRRS